MVVEVPGAIVRVSLSGVETVPDSYHCRTAWNSEADVYEPDLLIPPTAAGEIPACSLLVHSS